MSILNKGQRHLLADYFNNISAGWFLIGVVTPFIVGLKLDIISLRQILLSLFLSVLIISLGMIIIKE